ncbi:DUF4124 domain-containing protein [Acinetobacter towneri]|uniref:DUF4124 domain-containing protein n=1 Tax=Acinetobacter towneri TaxID=202956 RepID=UPI00185EFD10|nr:DUF4124 domain-containing protein [Acinetobacter towneri]MDM1721921.1 DUF4124 domain-containing protein [Acinetobacter towneri]HHW52742.1 DUF4124 domain-containing protein [Acinetobacter towneri]
MKNHVRRLSYLSASLMLILGTSSVSAKQYYKWVDAKGSTHYTTTPPPKTAKKQGKVDTYGWRNSAPNIPNQTTNATTAPANGTTPANANNTAPTPVMDQQQREANDALNKAQQERANPAVF